MSLKMKSRAGLSLIELLVALVLLGIVVTSVAGLTFQAARRSYVASGANYRQAALIAEMNRVMAVPYQTITAGTTCRTVTAMPFPHQVCVSAANLSFYSKTMTIIVRPNVRGVPADTLVFMRAGVPIVNPLNL